MPDKSEYPKPYENDIRAIKLVWNEEEEKALGPQWHPYRPPPKKARDKD